jgi:hypothetical protein
VGRRVEIRATLDEVVVKMGTELVGCHLRSWAKHRTVTDPIHDEARRQMHHTRNTVAGNGVDDGEVEVRDLAVYDRMLGVA